MRKKHLQIFLSLFFIVFLSNELLGGSTPRPIADLTAKKDLQIKLMWSSPFPQADIYYLKYTTYSAILNERHWVNAIEYKQSWKPLLPGMSETKILNGLIPGVTYYFAIKSSNTFGESGLDRSKPRPFAKAETFWDLNAIISGVSNCSIAFGDCDNDGDLDLVIAGSSADGYIARIYRNEDGRFTVVNANLIGVSNCSVSWGDYDNDGDLDLAIAGESAAGPVTKIYRNDENDKFVDIHSNIVGVKNCSIVFGDYDNDGDLDLAVAGNSTEGPITKIYQNLYDDKHIFTDINADIIGVSNCSVFLCDYDNDGDLDVILSGESKTKNLITKIYRNEGKNKFTDVNAKLIAVKNCSIVFGDYDNDGDLDLAIAGESAAGPVTKIYRNDENDKFVDIHSNIVGVKNCSLALADYDNDGDMDLAVAGNSAEGPIVKVYASEQSLITEDPPLIAGMTGAPTGALELGELSMPVYEGPHQDKPNIKIVSGGIVSSRDAFPSYIYEPGDTIQAHVDIWNDSVHNLSEGFKIIMKAEGDRGQILTRELDFTPDQFPSNKDGTVPITIEIPKDSMYYGKYTVGAYIVGNKENWATETDKSIKFADKIEIKKLPPKMVDLQPNQPSVLEDVLSPGASFFVNVVINNFGNLDCREFLVSVILSPGDIEIAKRKAKELKAWESILMRIEAKIPESMGTGDKQLKVKVDPYNRIEERNEKNNEWALAKFLKIRKKEPLLLISHIMMTKTQFLPKEEMDILVRIQNDGGAPTKGVFYIRAILEEVTLKKRYSLGEFKVTEPIWHLGGYKDISIKRKAPYCRGVYDLIFVLDSRNQGVQPKGVPKRYRPYYRITF